MELLFSREAVKGEQETRERIQAALDLVATSVGHDRFYGSAMALVTALATKLECERVSLGFVKRGRARVIAVSHSAEFKQQTNLIRGLADAMDEAIDQREIIVYPPPAEGASSVMQAHAEFTKEQGSGSIVNISTVVALKAMPGFPAHAYAAAKAGVNMLTKTIAIQYATQGIRCNAICPAGVDTPGVAGMTSDAGQRAAFDAMHPVGRMGRPEEIAHAAVYFASEESAWTTGSILSVDGGVTAQ